MPASVSGMEEDLNIAMDVASPVMDYTKDADPTRSRFRQRILRALVCICALNSFLRTVCIQGWYVVTVNAGDWRQYNDRASRCRLLYDLIKEQTGYESAFLFNDGERVMNKDISVSDDTEIIEDEDMVPANRSTGTKVKKERVKLDTEDFVPLPELSDDAEFAGTTVQIDRQSSFKRCECVFRSLRCH